MGNSRGKDWRGIPGGPIIPSTAKPHSKLSLAEGCKPTSLGLAPGLLTGARSRGSGTRAPLFGSRSLEQGPPCQRDDRQCPCPWAGEEGTDSAPSATLHCPSAMGRQDKGFLIFLFSQACAAELASLRFPPSPVPVPPAAVPPVQLQVSLLPPLPIGKRWTQTGRGLKSCSQNHLYSTKHIFHSIYSSSWGKGIGGQRGARFGAPHAKQRSALTDATKEPGFPAWRGH